MVQVLISGFILGLTLAVVIGPAFFALLQTSVHRGFRLAMFMAIGIFLSDLTLVILSFLGISQIISGERFRVVFGVVGGLILIAYGVYTFVKKTEIANVNVDRETDEDPEIIKKIKGPKPLLYVIKGYFLNLLNPFLLIFWMGMMAFVTAEYSNDNQKLSVFFGVTLVTVFCTDLLKCFVANQIKRWLKPGLISFINHALGVLLVCFGIYLIIRTFIEF